MTTIEILSELRSNYNCFDEQEEPVYRALSEAIKAASAQPKIIRCKDCKKYDSHGHRCKWWNHGVSNIDWCSYAERRTDGEIH